MQKFKDEENYGNHIFILKNYLAYISKYNIDTENLTVIEEFNINEIEFITILKHQDKDLFIFEDNTFNIFSIANFNNDISNEELKTYALKQYKLFTSKKMFLPPFDNLSLKQILDISRRINVISDNNYHSIDLLVNGDLVCGNIQNNIPYIKLLSTIKFLARLIINYNANCYRMKLLDFKYPNSYEYINSLLKAFLTESKNINVDDYIDENFRNDCEHIYEYFKELLSNPGIENYSKVSEKLPKLLELSDFNYFNKMEELNKTLLADLIDSKFSL